jgi:hypothetical protein
MCNIIIFLLVRNKPILLGLLVLLLIPIFLSAQWEQDVRLTTDDSLSWTSYTNGKNVAAGADGYVHAVWADNRDGNWEIYYKRSTDYGRTWGPDIRLTYDQNTSLHPAIAVLGTYIHIVWEDDRSGNYEIYYKQSTDRGTTWQPDTRITDAPYESFVPSIAVSGSYIHIAWQDNRNGGAYYPEIYYKRSTNNGLTWEPDIRLTYADNHRSVPSIAVSDNYYVHIVWHDYRGSNGNYEIYYRRSQDNGTSWDPEIRLTNATNDSWDPVIATSNTNLHVVWMDNRDGIYKIYYKRSSDNGVSWSQDFPLITETPYASGPSIVAVDSNLHVVWKDTRDGNQEAYYKYSPDNGTTWGIDTRLTNAQGNIYSGVFIAVSGTCLHVIWADNRDGNYEIYYKRNPTGNEVEEVINQKILSKNCFELLPNSFFAFTNVKYSIAKRSNVTIRVYNIAGQCVRTLVNTKQNAGIYEIRWNGEDDSNRKLPQGVYFLRMVAGDYLATSKIVMVR